MRTLLTLVAALALVASVAVEAQQGGGNRGGNRGGGNNAGPGNRGGGPGAFGMNNRGPALAEFVNGLKLTDEQKEKVKGVFDKEKEAFDAWDKDNATALKDVQDKMQKARDDRNRDAMLSAFEDMRILMDGRNKPIQDETMKKLADVLTAEQMDQVKARVELQAAGPQAVQLMGMLDKLDLQDYQKTRIKDMVKDTREKAARETDRRAAGQLWQTLSDDIEKNILTSEQASKFAELKKEAEANRPQPGNRGQGGQGGGNRGGGNRGGGGGGGGAV
ncbi:MAG: DUF3826 domain-containing protein [Phycisphaerae bacterium]|nr:DUF3826 domain-containing protein [Phycisphaerae bacterium]